MLRRIAIATAALTTILAGSGCSPKLRVNALQPATVNLGSARQLSVVQAQGRRTAREIVIEELINQARAGGHFTVADRSEEGITMAVAGRTAQLAGGNGQQAPGEVLLRLDIHEWSASQESHPVKFRDSKGHERTRIETSMVGKVLFAVTAVTPQGQVPMAEREYEARLATKLDENAAINAAAGVAIAQLLADVTPRYVRKTLELDDDDANQKPIIKVAKAGNVGLAIEELRTYIGKNPRNAIAQYNLAAMLDATGQFQEALEHYTKAIQGAPGKSLYVKAKAACARSLADAEALAQ